MRLLLACIVAALGGYIALSYEILWIRIYDFASAGEPDAFGILLASYLAGLAGGSYLSGIYCQRRPRGQRNQLFVAGACFLAANIVAFLATPVAANLMSTHGFKPESTLPVFALAAALLGTGFPLLSHFAIPPDSQAGFRLSHLYVSNIIGSTLGSLSTGLWLLDILPLRDLNVLLAISGSAIGILLMAVDPSPRLPRWLLAAGFVSAGASIIHWSPALYTELYEKLLYKDQYLPGAARFAHTFEGRSGVVNMDGTGTVFGSGSYDGQMNVNPIPSKEDNRIVRAYLVPAVHPAPRQILMVGLGSGSWLQVLANCPDVEQITVVEINPGFVDIMRRSPVVASAVDHPRVKIVFDDGRRFLRRTHRKFDVIIQNTIVYWRAHASTLLSREYMELSRLRLNPGGILYYNTTASTAAQKTGASVFPHALRFQNMLLVGNEPITVDPRRFEQQLDAWTIDGHSVLPPGTRAASLDLLREQEWRGVPTWETRDSILARTSGETIITDDNMATEWWAQDTYP